MLGYTVGYRRVPPTRLPGLPFSVPQPGRRRQPHSNFLWLNISGARALRAPCWPHRHLSTFALLTARCTHANPLSPSGFSLHFPLKYESPSNIYWGPRTQKAVVSLLWVSQKTKKAWSPPLQSSSSSESWIFLKKILNNNHTDSHLWSIEWHVVQGTIIKLKG